MKILTVVGARPQFIKAGPLSKELRKKHREIILHTGQHYDPNMSDIFFKELKIPKPDVNLGVGSGSHGEQTAAMMSGIEKYLLSHPVDLVLVYGDTNSTVAASLAAAKLHIPVGHIEAGLRSFNKRMPEELNRIVTDHLSDLLFAPTKNAVALLKKEGIIKGVYLTGDVTADAVIQHSKLAKKNDILSKLGLRSKSYILSTVHRAENTDDPKRLTAIFSAFAKSGEPVVIPLHPRTRKFIATYKLDKILTDQIKIIDPIGYLEMLQLEQNARLIASDSGGIQKEGYILGIPVVTLRDETEWVETVNLGWNKLVGADEKKITLALKNFHPKGLPKPEYGTGHASREIVKIITEWGKKRVRA